jgi:hypothetical protein
MRLRSTPHYCLFSMALRLYKRFCKDLRRVGGGRTPSFPEFYLSWGCDFTFMSYGDDHPGNCTHPVSLNEDGDIIHRFICPWAETSFFLYVYRLFRICIWLLFCIPLLPVESDTFKRYILNLYTGLPGKKHLFKTQVSLRRVLFGSDIL